MQIVQPSNIPPRLQRAGDYPLVCYSRYNRKAEIEPRSELWVRTRDGWDLASVFYIKICKQWLYLDGPKMAAKSKRGNPNEA